MVQPVWLNKGGGVDIEQDAVDHIFTACKRVDKFYSNVGTAFLNFPEKGDMSALCGTGES